MLQTRGLSHLYFLRPPRRTIVISLGLGIALAVGLADVALAAVPEPVMASDELDEYGPTATSNYLVWTQGEVGQFRRYSSFAKRPGQRRVRLNEPHTASNGAAVDGSTVLYAQTSRHHGFDLKLYHLGAGTRTNPGPGVNTNDDEDQPSISGSYLFFTRRNFDQNKGALILYDRTTETSRVLAMARPRHHYLISNQVNGDWAVWEKCKFDFTGGYTNCNVFRYRISTKQTVRVPNPGKQQYGSAVTSDGTVYFVVGGGSDYWDCGTNAKLVRYPVGGPRTVIASLPSGRDALSMFAFEEGASPVTLYFDRTNCRLDQDIYKLSNADTA
jgi:hypothetical protein